MHRKLFAGFAASTILALATPVVADPVRIVSNGSGIAGLAYAEEGGIDQLLRHPDTPTLNDSFTLTAQVGGTTATGSASIAGDVTDLLRMRATGSTGASYSTSTGGGEGHVSSHFFVFFETDQPLAFVFDGDFTTSGDAMTVPEQEHWSAWNVTLFEMGAGGSAREVLAGAGTESTTFLRDGLLLPGLYRFHVQSTSFAGRFVPGPAAGNVFSNFAFAFDLNELHDEQPAPTPEPATLLLLGSGLGGVIVARRRRTAARG